jgi:2-iminobutanoate/2-iminopropanoate deaminase
LSIDDALRCAANRKKEDEMKTLMLLVFAIPLIAFAQSKPARKYIKPEGTTPRPFNEAVIVGDTMYVAGHIGLDPKTGKPPADVEQEIKLLLDSFKADVEKGGMTMDDLVMVTVHCPDVSLYDKFNAAYKTYFKGDLPARAFLGSGPLLFGAHFEMLGTAVKR